MKNNKFLYLPFDKFILRTPILPFTSVNYFIDSYESLLKFLKKNVYILEAIYLASPLVYSETLKLLNGKIENQKDRNKILITLSKYLLRMSCRCSPFGLFSGCSIGELSIDKSSIVMLSKHNKNFQLDIISLNSIIRYILNYQSIKNSIKYYLNNSIYIILNEITYIKSIIKSNSKILSLQKVPLSDTLSKIILNSKHGISLSEIATLLKKADLGSEEIEIYINQLIDSQIITSELELDLTDSDHLESILNVLNRTYDVNNELKLFKEDLFQIKKLLSELNSTKQVNKIEIHENIYKILTKYFPSLEKNQLIYANIINQNKINKINRNSLNEISEILNYIPYLLDNDSNQRLEKFKQQFKERYQDQEIPLVFALDPEVGINYLNNSLIDKSSQLLDEIFQNNLSANKQRNNYQFSSLDSYLLDVYLSAIKSNIYNVELNLEELQMYCEKSLDFPNTLSVLIKIYDKIEGNSNYLKQLLSITSYSTNLISRFCNFNNEIYEFAKSMTDFEKSKDSDVIIAELLYLPGLKEANILRRRSLYDYEIVYLSKSNLAPEYQISINELLISIKNNKIILRSKLKNKEVLPRNSNSYNYQLSKLPIVNFLCDLQFQNITPGFRFNWGFLSERYNFYPRISYKNVILCLAKWKFYKKDLINILNSTPPERTIMIFNLRTDNSIPKYVSVGSTERKLVIDFDSILCLDILRDILKPLNDNDPVFFEEFIEPTNNDLVKSDNRAYVNEFIFSYHKNDFRTQDLISSQNCDKRDFYCERNNRVIIPGEEWVSYKLYCSESIADKILVNVIKIFVDNLIAENLIDKWFFIRFGDPEFHLRIRFHLKEIIHLDALIHKFNDLIKLYVENNIITKIQIDTYRRELERYDVNLMPYVETLFYLDSMAVINVLNLFIKEHEEDLRLIFGLKSIDMLLNDFNLNLDKKIVFVNSVIIDISNSLEITDSIIFIIDKKYRKYKKTIEQLFSDKIAKINELVSFNATLNWRSFMMKTISGKIINSADLKLLEYLRIYIHMSINRLFLGNTRKFELLIYIFLLKYYKSNKAILHNSIVKNAN